MLKRGETMKFGIIGLSGMVCFWIDCYWKEKEAFVSDLSLVAAAWDRECVCTATSYKNKL
jgi:hypothetical protein